jgi:predicted RNA-binding protein with PUA-like domain
MNYWLVKSEPNAYSWEQFLKDKSTVWSGVRNYAARNHLRAMKKGDKVLFYHSNEGLCIVGIAEVKKEHYQDPTTEEIAWSAVDLAPLETLKHPVSLAELKKDALLKNMKFVQIGRLSVSPVTAKEFEKVCLFANKK